MYHVRVHSLGNQDALHPPPFESRNDCPDAPTPIESSSTPNPAPTPFADAMTSASVPALPIDVWSHVAQFLPVRDRVALLDASVSTREAVLRDERRISDFLDGREHFFHHPGGAPCVDVEANASFARGLLRHAEYVLPCADAEAVLLAAMSSALPIRSTSVAADAASTRASARIAWRDLWSWRVKT